MRERLKGIALTAMALLMFPITLPLIVIGYLWGHASKALNLGARTAALGSMVSALEEEGY